MSTARTAPAGTKTDPIVLGGEPEVGPPAKRGRFDFSDGTGGMVRFPKRKPNGDRFRTPGGLESVAESEAEEGSPSPDPTPEPEHSQSSQSSVSSGPVDESETLPVYEEDEEDEEDEEPMVCFVSACDLEEGQTGEIVDPNTGENVSVTATFELDRESMCCDACLNRGLA